MNDSTEKKANINGQTIASVRIEDIQFNPDHLRKTPNSASLKAVVEFIKIFGVLQPILVTKGEDGKVHLVLGERRVRAARLAGLKEIPAIYVDPQLDDRFPLMPLMEKLSMIGLERL